MRSKQWYIDAGRRKLSALSPQLQHSDRYPRMTMRLLFLSFVDTPNEADNASRG